MNQTISKSLDKEGSGKVHVALFKYNFTSNSLLQKCYEPSLYIRDGFGTKMITVELSHKRCIIRRLHRCLIYRINPSCMFKQIVFVLRRNNDIKLQLECQSNIAITEQAKLEFNNITILEVLDEVACRNGVVFVQTVHSTVSFHSGKKIVTEEDEIESIVVKPFFVGERSDSIIGAIKEMNRNKEKGFRQDSRYYLKWGYLSLGALTIIIFVATTSALLIEFYFQHQHYLAKNKPIKLLSTKNF